LRRMKNVRQKTGSTLELLEIKYGVMRRMRCSPAATSSGSDHARSGKVTSGSQDGLGAALTTG